MATKEFIVAIELGSSKVTGIAGQKNLDGSINVLAVVKEESSSFIRKGVAYNIDKTALCISNISAKDGDYESLRRSGRTVYQKRQKCNYERTACRHKSDGTDGH